ncbi:MAG: ABC transporter permease [Desulfatirhabdiaceae bacterium]
MISVGMMRDVWSFRDFMWSSVKREFQSRWTGTQFGPFWIVAHPLANILIFTVIFAQIMKPSLPNHSSRFAYSIYLCSGVLTWNLFAEMLGRCVNIFVENANLLKKVHFPKLCLPIIVVASNVINFAVVMILFITFMLIIEAFPGWVILSVLPVLIIQLAFTVGLGVLLATINVFYRDVHQTVQVVLQFWFWLTPIVYVATTLPESVLKAMNWNPMWVFIHAYHGIFLEKTLPDWTSLVYPSILAVFLLWIGIFAFHRLQGEIVDEL